MKYEMINYRAKKLDKPNQNVQSNQWISNGNLGSKDAVLVFRTNVLTSPTSLTTSTTDSDPDYGDSSVTAENSKTYLSSMLLPQTVNSAERRIDSENFNFVEKKSKKRLLESSSSTSSSSSLISSVSMNNLEVKTESCEEKDVENENKENLQIVPPIDKEEMPAALFNITYKFLNTETRLLRKILNGHGMYEISHDANDWNLLWTGNQLKPDILRNLSSYQRINHFPR
jgi:tubulin polyglutamylase TTLL5